MRQGRNQATATRLHSRSKCTWCAIIALLAATVVTSAGCDEEASLLAFRSAASSNLQSGLKGIMDGIIEGMFAVFELGGDADTSSSSSSS